MFEIIVQVIAMVVIVIFGFVLIHNLGKNSRKVELDSIVNSMIDDLKSPADRGNSESQYKIGVLYEKQGNFDLAEIYLKLAIDYHKSLADSGYVDIQNILGILYEAQEEFDLAKYYYKLAANNGHPEAEEYFEN